MKKQDKIAYLQKELKKVEVELLTPNISKDKKLDLRDSKIKLMRELNTLKGINCSDTNLRTYTNSWFQDKVYGKALHGVKL